MKGKKREEGQLSKILLSDILFCNTLLKEGGSGKEGGGRRELMLFWSPHELWDWEKGGKGGKDVTAPLNTDIHPLRHILRPRKDKKKKREKSKVMPSHQETPGPAYLSLQQCVSSRGRGRARGGGKRGEGRDQPGSHFS